MRITGRRPPFRVSDTRRSALSQAGRILPGYPAKPAPASRVLCCTHRRRARSTPALSVKRAAMLARR